MGWMMNNGTMGMGSFGGWSGMGFGLPGLGMLLFWGLLIAGGVVLVRALARTPRNGGASATFDSALEALAVRFAKGEVTQTEFESMRRTLSGK